MIAFKDFAPQVVVKSGMFEAPAFESFQESVEAASRWCREAGIVPLNVETLLLTGSQEVQLPSGGRATERCQVARVWYLAK